MTSTAIPADRRWWHALVVLAVLCAATWWIFGRALDVRPLGGDNLYALSWVNRAPASQLLRLDPIIYPEWRPIPYATVWLQYAWQGLDRVAMYHVVNLAIWASCAWLIYLVALRLGASRLAAFAAIGLVLGDVRAIAAQTLIIERQTTLAALCGVSAIWVAIADRGPRRSWPKLVALGSLCLASALSKEYGLAFAAGLIAYGLIERRRDLVLSAAAGVAAYFAARWTFAGGASGRYCEYMGYFFDVRKICYDDLSGTTAAQMTYNVIATGVGTLLPGLLTPVGRIAVAPLRLTASVLLLAVAVIGWRRGPRELRLAGLVMAAGTALNFMLYADRNQLTSVCMLGLVMSAGLTVVDRQLRARGSRAAATVAVAGVVVLAALQAQRTRVEVGQQVDDLLQQDPCMEIARTEQHDPAFIRLVKAHYGMSDPDCRAPR